MAELIIYLIFISLATLPIALIVYLVSRALIVFTLDEIEERKLFKK